MEFDSKFYDEIYNAGGNQQGYKAHYSHSRYFPVWWYIMKNWLGPDNILDLGCGVGQFAQMVFDYKVYNKYVGTDFSKVAIDQAKARKLPPEFKFYTYDITWWLNRKLFKDFETYIALEVLEHLPEDLEFEVLNTIPPGKTVILSLPNYMAQGHYRTYRGADEIIERYRKYLDVRFSKEFIVNPKTKAKITAIKAIRYAE